MGIKNQDLEKRTSSSKHVSLQWSPRGFYKLHQQKTHYFSGKFLVSVRLKAFENTKTVCLM